MASDLWPHGVERISNLAKASTEQCTCDCEYVMTMPHVCSTGHAAQQQNSIKAIEQLAAEVEAGSSNQLRTVWKWACYQVLFLLSLLAACP